MKNFGKNRQTIQNNVNFYEQGENDRKKRRLNVTREFTNSFIMSQMAEPFATNTRISRERARAYRKSIQNVLWRWLWVRWWCLLKIYPFIFDKQLEFTFVNIIPTKRPNSQYECQHFRASPSASQQLLCSCYHWFYSSSKVTVRLTKSQQTFEFHCSGVPQG